MCNLKIVYKNGKFFINSSDKVVFLDDSSEVKFIDDYKKEIIAEEEVLNNEFELEKLEFVKNPRLSIKDIFKIALNGLTNLK